MSASYSLDVASLPAGHLLVGLLDPISSGASFTSLEFSIFVEGAPVVDQSFTTAASATIYFDDQALDLGPLVANDSGTMDIHVALTMSTLDNGTRYGTNFIVADVGATLPALSGDYNNNGIVDAADYVVWRKTGINGQQGYDTWRANFGQIAGSGSGAVANAAVPEPATFAMLIMALAEWCVRRRRSVSPVPKLVDA